MKRYLIPIFFCAAFVFYQCASDKNDTVLNSKEVAEDVYKNFVMQSAIDTSIKLSLARLNDRCGEWGGDLEWITVNQNSKGELFATYIFNNLCGSDNSWLLPSYNDYKKKQVKGSVELGVLIHNCIKELLNNPTHKNEIAFFGNKTQIMLSDSTYIKQGTATFEWPTLDTLIKFIKQSEQSRRFDLYKVN